MRQPFYLFLDEFQDFCAGDGAAKTLAQILSECRKFGLHLHLAHQTLGQVHHRVSSALGNVGIKVVFAVDREDAEVMAKKLFAVDTEEIKHDAQTQTQHPLFSPLGEQWEEATAAIQDLPPRTALVKRRGHTVIQMQTRPIRSYGLQAEAVDELIRDLARRHGIPASQGLDASRPTEPGRSPIQLTDWEPLPQMVSSAGFRNKPSRVIYEYNQKQEP